MKPEEVERAAALCAEAGAWLVLDNTCECWSAIWVGVWCGWLAAWHAKPCLGMAWCQVVWHGMV